MKPLHNASHAAEAHLIRGYLESQGIEVIIRGEFLASGIGDLPADVCKVWVVNDDDFAHADSLVRQFLQGGVAREHTHAPWRCGFCHEDIEGQFTACWKCGNVRSE